MDEKTTYRMKAITESEEWTRSVFICDTADGAFEGTGSKSYQCATCDNTLIRGIDARQMIGIIFKCGECGGFNEIPTTHQAD